MVAAQTLVVAILDTLVVAITIQTLVVALLIHLVVAILDTLVDLDTTLVVTRMVVDVAWQVLVVLDTHMVGVACHQVLVVVAKLDRRSLMMVMELQSST